MTAGARDYVAIARRYAEGVLSGSIAACEWVKEACRRQLDDLERQDLEYTYDEKRASRVCKFNHPELERLYRAVGQPHLEGH